MIPPLPSDADDPLFACESLDEVFDYISNASEAARQVSQTTFAAFGRQLFNLPRRTDEPWDEYSERLNAVLGEWAC